jgi:outer membrane receptor protein involved in Fe transport
MKTLMVLLAGLLAQSLFGQSAELIGVVKDPSGGVVAGASVELRNQDTGVRHQTTTNKDGFFYLPGLAPGSYLATFEARGFKTLTRQGIVLQVAQRASLDVSLEVGTVEEHVTVRSSEPLLNTADGSVSTVVGRSFVSNIPLNGRSFQSLIQLTPGVVVTKTSATNGGQFSVNGQRADANYFTVDGVSANIGVAGGTGVGQYDGGALPGLSVAGGTNNLVSVDDMQEFRIQTSSYAPEFGRTPGGQIQVVTRSGTNQFHGDAFDYLRNDVLDANNWFNNASQPALAKAKDRQNDFGFVLGGPVLLPYYNGKDRTFFFVSYEGLRLRQPVTAITQVPSLAARQAAIPVMQPYLNAYPIPNGPNLSNGLSTFSASFSNPSTLNSTSVRIDQAISSRLTLFGRFSDAPSNLIQRTGSFGNGSANTLGYTALESRTVTLGSTWIVTPTVSADFRGNWSMNRINNYVRQDNYGGAVPLTQAQEFPSFVNELNGAFTMQMGGTGTVYQTGENAASRQRQLNFTGSFSVIEGSHQLKFGGDYRRLYPIFDPTTYSASYLFSGATGMGAGTISGGAIAGIYGVRYPIFNNYSLYAQDTWKVNSRLTLTYGLRWDLNPPPHERDGNQFGVVGLDDPATMTVSAKGVPLWNTSYGNVAWRAGAAYRLGHGLGGETVLRLGAGVFYDLGYGTADEALGNSWPFTTRKTLTAGMPFPFDDATAEPAPFAYTASPSAPATGFYVAIPDLKLPRTYQWNVSVEHSLGRAQAFTASYVGALGSDLLRQDILYNPNPDFGTVYVTRNTASSNYQALQLQFNRQLSQRLQAIVSYTWAHSLDDASTDVSRNAPSTSVNIDTEWGPSDFDIRHTLSAAVTYSVPGPYGNRFAKALLGGWALDGILVARSSTPVNVITGTDVFHLGATDASRPDVVPGAPLYLYGSGYPGGKVFNKAAFINIPANAQRQGSLGRNALRGFPVSQLDLVVRREFPLTEKVKLQFRSEFFNVFNHPNFADPINNLSNALFGRSTQMLAPSLGSSGINGGFNPLYQMGGPRSIQVAAKLVF